MYDTCIAQISYHIPQTQVAVTDLLKEVPDKKLPAAFSTREEYANYLQTELNLTHIRVEQKLDDHMMLTETVDKLFREDNTPDPEQIDLIILAQEHDQRQKDNLAQYIQFEFDMDNAWIINLSGNHCANIDYALTIASEMASNNPRINNILILGNVKITDPAERLIGTYGLLSDGSGAMLLNKQESGWSLKQSRILSAGRLHNVDLNRDDSLLLCKYYVRCMQELLQQAGLQPEQVAHVITQNANPLLVTQCMESIGISKNKLFTENSSRYAHMDCVDFLVNLKDLTRNLQQSTDKGTILTFGTGWAGSFISSLIHHQ